MTEQQPYALVETHPGFEVRDYPEHIVAEVAVRGSFTSAGNTAFPALAGFIGGRNRSSQKVAMTAPVLQQQDDEQLLVAFVMPSDMDSASMPEPSDPSVRMRVIPAQKAAAARFSGRWTRSSYEHHVHQLLEDVRRAGLEPIGEPRFARYDPPWTPWFLRRNEVIVQVAGG